MPIFASASFSAKEVIEIIAKAAAAKGGVPLPPHVKIVTQGHLEIPKHGIVVVFRDGYECEAAVQPALPPEDYDREDEEVPF